MEAFRHIMKQTGYCRRDYQCRGCYKGEEVICIKNKHGEREYMCIPHAVEFWKELTGIIGAVEIAKAKVEEESCGT